MELESQFKRSDSETAEVIKRDIKEGRCDFAMTVHEFQLDDVPQSQGFLSILEGALMTNRWDLLNVRSRFQVAPTFAPKIVNCLRSADGFTLAAMIEHLAGDLKFPHRDLLEG